MDQIIHGVMDPKCMYLLDHGQDGWDIRAVVVNLRDLELEGKADIYLANHPMAKSVPLATDQMPRIIFAYGPRIGRLSRQQVDALIARKEVGAQMGQTEQRISLDNDFRERAAGVLASISSAAARYGINEADWRAVNLNPIAIAYSLALRSYTGPKHHVADVDSDD